MIVTRLPGADLPLVPDPDEARRWAERELAKPEYDVAQPTVFDRIAQAVGDFLRGLFTGAAPHGWDGLLAVILITVVVLLLIAAFLVWGRPRATRRSRAAVAELFGGDELSAAALRHEAGARAASGDWDAAIVLRFRALARALAERGVVDPVPGATVHAFAAEASRAFPEHVRQLDAAAAAFDDVRYLRRPGTEELYTLIADTDAALAAARPLLPDLADAAR